MVQQKVDDKLIQLLDTREIVNVVYLNNRHSTNAGRTYTSTQPHVIEGTRAGTEGAYPGGCLIMWSAPTSHDHFLVSLVCELLRPYVNTFPVSEP